jgi:EAL domain-containing protein (putative c-di-GMP-specific phosphodiesterase class I)
LDLKIVAEGVETQAQLKFLQAEGCDAIQGFLMSAAIAAAPFAELLRQAAFQSVRKSASPIRSVGQRAGARGSRK